MKSVRSAMMSVVVPALNEVCRMLFQQLNEAFRMGLEEYMNQMRELSKEALAAGEMCNNVGANPMSTAIELPSLMQLIEHQRIPDAFEKVLKK